MEHIRVAMRNIWKSFPGVVANRGIDLDLRAGEVHALLGENGAGKTTLMNILAGVYNADQGEILVDGRKVRIHTPIQAINSGIGMVHQHFRLVDDLTVAENVQLGWKKTPWHVSRKSLGLRLKDMMSELDFSVDPNAQIWQLSVGEQQRVEIVRVLARGANVLILDEPTSVLTPIESTELFKALRKLAARGHTVVFISHKLDEVLEISDQVTILRHGKVVDSLPTKNCDQKLLAKLMIGQNVVFQRYKKEKTPGSTVLEMQDIKAENDRGLLALDGINLTLRQGEILGIAGVAGNGQKELAEVLTGLRTTKSGKILIEGVDHRGKSPSELAMTGIGHIPEDRLGWGLFPQLSITHNAILREYHKPPIKRGIRLVQDAEAGFTRDLLQKANVQAHNLNAQIGTLSGGNQQKLLARREIDIAQKLLVAVHPTRGMDVAATEDIRCTLIEHRNNGCAVLLISEDLDEILLLSDRIAVMFGGKIVGLMNIEQVNRDEIGLLMGGSRLEPKGDNPRA